LAFPPQLDLKLVARLVLLPLEALQALDRRLGGAGGIRGIDQVELLRREFHVLNPAVFLPHGRRDTRSRLIYVPENGLRPSRSGVALADTFTAPVRDWF